MGRVGFAVAYSAASLTKNLQGNPQDKSTSNLAILFCRFASADSNSWSCKIKKQCTHLTNPWKRCISGYDVVIEPQWANGQPLQASDGKARGPNGDHLAGRRRNAHSSLCSAEWSLCSQEALLLGGFRNIYTRLNKQGDFHKEARVLVTLVIGWQFWCAAADIYSL